MLLASMIEGIVKHVRAALQPEYYHRSIGTVLAVAVDGTCSVDCQWGPLSGIRVLHPYPDCSIKFAEGAVVVLAWPEGRGGPEQLPHIVGFVQGISDLPVFRLEIATNGGTTGDFVARVNDRVQTTISFADTDQLFVLGSMLLSTGLFTPSGVTPVPPPARVDFEGKIMEGSEKVKVG